MMRWISVPKETGECRSRRLLHAFALRMTLRASAMAFVASLVLLPLADAAGFAVAPATDYLRLAALVSVISGAMCGWVSWRAGRTIERLTLSNVRFRKLSRTDALSGLLNRRAFTEALETADPGVCLVIVDVDHFKHINDRYGHATGDHVIRRLSMVISEAAGTSACRLGGEEFGFLLETGTVDERLAQVDALRARIAAETFYSDRGPFRVTISAGLADLGIEGRPEFAYAAADRALYLAKAGGRNRVVHSAYGLGAILELAAAERQDVMPEAEAWQGTA